jgi:hypothetical protein
MIEEIVNQPFDIRFIVQGICPRCLQQTLTDRKELSRWLGKHRVANYTVFTCTNDECRARFKVPKNLIAR